MQTRNGSGMWLATVRRRKLMWFGHDALYVAWGRLRVRWLKPWRAER